ncbi:MAG TPA: thioesterase family protein [Nocardioidaceae bacterium]|nr:thioesterase family protein [Nocardioidaceae bacterium]
MTSTEHGLRHPLPGSDTEFDRAIAVEPLSMGVYDGHLDRSWSVGEGINGGLLLASAANALGRRFVDEDHPDPISISAYYLSAATHGPARFTTEVLRRGRNMSTGSVSLEQHAAGRPVERLRAIATYGDLTSLPSDVHTTAVEPDLPDLDKCIGSDLAPADFRAKAPLLERFDLRLDPDTVGWAVGEPSGRGMIRGWLRMADGREPDPLSLLLALDALPPVTFDLGLPGWAPTLELTAHVRAVPAPGWLKVVHATRNHAGGLFEEDAEVWDSAGRLVAQSRQLARAPRS